MVKVDRPRPSRAVLPSRVTGKVGRVSGGLKVTPKLTGARVLLQARPAAGAPWTTMDRDRVDRAGKYALSWHPKVRLRLLRVSLHPHKSFAGSAATVPTAPISACKVAKRGGGWSVRCATTAKDDSLVRLFRHRKVVDRTHVRDGRFRLHGTGAVGAHTIDITVKGHHIRLDL
jgi:hypothetical protein